MALVGDKSLRSHLLSFSDKSCNDWLFFVGVKEEWTLILDDPAGNSYVQNVYAPDDDPELTIENYERTFEQNDELGLNDMKTEGYEEDS